MFEKRITEDTVHSQIETALKSKSASERVNALNEANGQFQTILRQGKITHSRESFVNMMLKLGSMINSDGNPEVQRVAQTLRVEMDKVARKIKHQE